jgi:hypothetical protein
MKTRLHVNQDTEFRCTKVRGTPVPIGEWPSATIQDGVDLTFVGYHHVDMGGYMATYLSTRVTLADRTYQAELLACDLHYHEGNQHDRKSLQG